MKQINFVKKGIIEALENPLESLDETKILLKKFTGKDFSLNSSFIYNYFSRREYLLEIFNALNTKGINPIFIGGFQGTGKTELVKAVNHALEEQVLRFYYECSIITNLDDIMLSLYGYLNKFSDDNQRIKPLRPQSIDEMLVNYVNNLKRPLLICLDSFEYLLNEQLKVADSELSKFLNFLLGNPLIKIIIVSKKLPHSTIGQEKDNFLTVRLGGFDEETGLLFLQNKGISGAGNLLNQVFEVARGYPESLLWFSSAINSLKISPFDILREYLGFSGSFEEYIARKVYLNLPQSFKKLVWFFAVIRHPISNKAFEKMKLAHNPGNILEYLVSRMLITCNNDFYYMKPFIKEVIKDSIPEQEKVRIHSYLHELYAEQIAIKLVNRIFPISRKLLHSEQYYHYVCAGKQENKPGATKKTKQLEFEIYKSKNDFSYLAPKISQSVEEAEQAFLNELLEKTRDEDEKPVEKKKQNTEEPKTVHVPTTAVIELDNNFKIELSEEERALLGDDSSDDDQNIDVVYQEKQPEPVKIQPNLVQREELLKKAAELVSENKLDFALDNYKEAYKISQKLDDKTAIGSIGVSISEIMHKIHRYDDAVDYLDKSLQAYKILNDKKSVNTVLSKLGDVHTDCYKHELALRYYKQVLDSDSGYIDDKSLLNAYLGCADIYSYRENLDQALDCYKKAVEKAVIINDIENIAKLLFKTALIYDDMGDYNNAIKYYKKNIELTDDFDVNPYLAPSLSNIASLYEENGDNFNAIDYYTRALDVDKKTNNYDGQFTTLSRLANLYLTLGNMEKANKYYHEEMEVARKTNDPYVIATSYLEIGDFYLAQKLYEKAVKSFILARKSIGNTISTDSKEKIDRRFKLVVADIGEAAFNQIIESLKKKDE